MARKSENDWESDVEIRIGLDPAFLEEQSTPEKNLLAAVLASAIRDAMKIKTLGFESENVRATHALNALEWLRINQTISPEELLNPLSMSFVWIAQALDCDPVLLRDQIAVRLEDSGLKGVVIHRNASK